MQVVPLFEDHLENPEYDPAALLDGLKAHLNVKSDAKLAYALYVGPQVIYRLRGRNLCLSGGLLVRMHDITNLSLDTLRAMAKLKRPDFR